LANRAVFLSWAEASVIAGVGGFEMILGALARFTARHVTTAVAISSLTAVLCLSEVGAQTANSVTIRGLDYAFQSPDTIVGGPTLFTFENHGTVRHEVVISRLKEGHTLSEVVEAKTPADRNALLDGLVGLVIADAGKTALGQLLASMEKGRSYVLFCNLRDSPEKPQHMALGMARLLYVR
jgi:hypothetical protein